MNSAMCRRDARYEAARSLVVHASRVHAAGTAALQGSESRLWWGYPEYLFIMDRTAWTTTPMWIHFSGSNGTGG